MFWGKFYDNKKWHIGLDSGAELKGAIIPKGYTSIPLCGLKIDWFVMRNFDIIPSIKSGDVCKNCLRVLEKRAKTE